MPDDILCATRPVRHLTPSAHGSWTLADYESLPDDGMRYELINGDLRMTPAPNLAHQTSSLWIVHHLFTLIEMTGAGRVFTAPVDVQLDGATIVQPDIVVVLRDGAASLTEQRIVGPPDLIVEITSPSTASYDRREKRDRYAAAGVREYWIADPASRSVELLILEGENYRAEHVYRGQAIIPSSVVLGWAVVTDALFG
ncbi:MAG: Uma2 family endonuclease [Candidatus Viridilinea halotolerans]|uniref:Uma2 family endonuclease n=1 Tax=Candidatus Viridilinea halotolerans TaxID=2491704 RepID=A0A426UCN0_9CHLR|nr:MAG: Uma2 family endonuclease [Candidatus Viridilinea halotolerans]